MSGQFLLFGALTTWITPLWLLGLGATLGLVVLIVAYGVTAAVSSRAAAFLRMSVHEGILQPLLLLAVVLAGFTLLATPIVPYRSLLESVKRLPAVGDSKVTQTIPAASKDFSIPVPFRPGELESFELLSDQPLTVMTHVSKGAGPHGAITLTRDKRSRPWKKSSLTEQALEPETKDWTVTNLEDKPATLEIFVHTGLEYPEVRIVPLVAASLVGLFVVYLAIGLAVPKIAAIAATTSKESMSQPLFYVSLVIGAVALMLFIIIPYFTLGEDIKVLKDTGMTSIMLLAIFVAVWSASVSISDEIEGRTALMVLSKPVRRSEFILGKFLGIMWPVLLMFIVLGVCLLFAVSFKVVYEAREGAKGEPTWQVCYWEMSGTVPGLVLAFFEAMILAAISVAISTKLSMLANLLICSAIYVLGHMVPMLVNSSVGKFEIVRFVGHLIATVLPVLDHFNIQAAIAAGTPVPLDLLVWEGAYCLLYTTIAMLVALALFEDRDLA